MWLTGDRVFESVVVSSEVTLSVLEQSAYTLFSIAEELVKNESVSLHGYRTCHMVRLKGGCADNCGRGCIVPTLPMAVESVESLDVHAKVASRYFTVRWHGSPPNRLLLTENWHVALPMHIFSRTALVVAALQDPVLKVLPDPDLGVQLPVGVP